MEIIIAIIAFVIGMIVMDLMWAYKLGLLQAFIAAVKQRMT
jgi:hypothetical protein